MVAKLHVVDTRGRWCICTVLAGRSYSRNYHREGYRKNSQGACTVMWCILSQRHHPSQTECGCDDAAQGHAQAARHAPALLQKIPNKDRSVAHQPARRIPADCKPRLRRPLDPADGTHAAGHFLAVLHGPLQFLLNAARVCHHQRQRSRRSLCMGRFDPVNARLSLLHDRLTANLEQCSK